MKAKRGYAKEASKLKEDLRIVDACITSCIIQYEAFDKKERHPDTVKFETEKLSIISRLKEITHWNDEDFVD